MKSLSCLTLSNAVTEQQEVCLYDEDKKDVLYLQFSQELLDL